MKKQFKEIKKTFENQKNIIRVIKNRENPYVIIYKKSLEDSNLSWAAKGLYSYLLSLPDNWTIYVSELLKHTSSGRDHTYSVIKELLENGYMEKVQYRCDGKILGLNYTVFEESTHEDNSNAKIKNITLDDNGEIVEISTIEPYTENPYTVSPDTVSTELLNNNNNNTNNNNKDLVVVVSEKEKNLFDLYKSFKLEKKFMPHTRKLLKKYMDKFDLDVFEQVFISASSDSVKKKYAYIKKVLETLDSKGIRTLEDYNKDQEEYKASKEKKYSKASNKANNGDKNKVVTKFHNINTHCDKYTTDELESMVKGSQSARGISKKDPIHDMYIKACENGTDSLSSQSMVQIVIDYALKNNLDKPPKTVSATV